MTIKLKNVHISGSKIGISSNGPVSLDMTNVTFDNVAKPFDIKGAAEVRATGTKISGAAAFGLSRVGYTGRNGPPLPAQCPKCQSIFPSQNYDIGSSLFYGFDNEEVCQNPDCHYEHAKLAIGLYNLAKEVVVIIQGEPLTHAMLKAITSASQDLIEGKSDAAATIDRISQVSEKLGRVFAKAVDIAGSAAGFMALWFAIFPSQLDAVQQGFGEGAKKDQRAFQIEKICLESLGEVSRLSLL